MKKIFSMFAFVAMCVVLFTACEGLDLGIGKKDKYPVSGTHNGHDYVDLGLSVMWATCNIGAKNPEDYGDYFAWGEVEPKTVYNWHTYKFAQYVTDTTIVFTKYCNLSDDAKDGIVDNKYVLDLEDDAARVNWGGKWRMPTTDEINELMNRCFWNSHVHTSSDGDIDYSDGWQIMGAEGANNNYMFLPAAGYMIEDVLYDEESEDNVGCYWSNRLSSENSSLAYYIWATQWSAASRAVGLTIRPVLDLNE